MVVAPANKIAKDRLGAAGVGRCPVLAACDRGVNWRAGRYASPHFSLEQLIIDGSSWACAMTGGNSMRAPICLATLVLITLFPLMAAAKPTPLIDAKGNVNYKVLRAACQGAPPYAVKFGGAKIKGEASLTEAATKQLLAKVSDKLASFPVPDDLDISAQAVIADERVGVTFASAFEGVGNSYFCMLRTVYANDAAKQSALSTLESFYRKKMILSLASPALYKDSTNKIKTIDALMAEADSLKPSFKTTEVQKALGRYSFDRVSKAQLDAVVKSKGFATLSACGGVLTRSQADLDSRILSRLETLDSSFAFLLTGNGSVAVATLAALGQELYETGPAAVKLEVNDLLCAKSANEEVKDTIKESVKEGAPIKADAKDAPKTLQKKEEPPPAPVEPKPAVAV